MKRSCCWDACRRLWGSTSYCNWPMRLQDCAAAAAACLLRLQGRAAAAETSGPCCCCCVCCGWYCKCSHCWEESAARGCAAVAVSLDVLGLVQWIDAVAAGVKKAPTARQPQLQGLVPLLLLLRQRLLMLLLFELLPVLGRFCCTASCCCCCCCC